MLKKSDSTSIPLNDKPFGFSNPRLFKLWDYLILMLALHPYLIKGVATLYILSDSGTSPAITQSKKTDSTLYNTGQGSNAQLY